MEMSGFPVEAKNAQCGHRCRKQRRHYSTISQSPQLPNQVVVPN
jgi:hypothetical protein